MDRHFYEFWSQIFASLAQGQQQMDDFNRWRQKGLEVPDAFSSFLRKAYGLEGPPDSAAPSLELWEKSTEAFQKSLKDFLALFDMVPRGDYEKLAEECRELKEKAAKQEETIRVLRQRRGKKAASPEAAVEGLRQVIQKQNDQFQGLMETVGDLFRKPPKS